MPVTAILTALEAGGSFIWKHWRAFLSAAVVGSLLFLIHVRTVQRDALSTKLQTTQAAFNETVTSYKLAAEKARADDLAHARDVESQQAKAAQETQDALQTQLATLRANLASYAQRVRTSPGAYQSGSSNPSVPGVSNPASGLAENGSSALVPVPLGDLDTCAVNTANAIGWQNWYKQVSAIKR